MLRDIQALPRAEFLAWQQRTAWEIVDYQRANNPFFRARVPKRPREWQDLPTLGKSDLQEPIETLLAEPFREGGPEHAHIDNTSGSSGHPFWYAKDRFCHAMSWALVKERYGRWNLGTRSRQARFYGIPRDRRGSRRERAKDLLMNRVRFPVFDLSDATLAKFHHRFARDRFQFVYGYTHSLVLFARYLERQGLILRDACPSLEVCMVTSEVCRNEDREFLTRTFGVPVVNEYGASECSIIAFEYPDGSWRLSEETLLVETTDDGEVLITSLFNRAYPLIRYRIGDIAQIGPRSDDRIHRSLEALEGRTNDVIHLPSGRTAAGLTFYYVLRAVLEQTDAVREFLVRQTALDRFELEIIARRDMRPDEVATIEKEVLRYLEPGLTVEIQRVDEIERPPSGKIKQFVSDLPREASPID